MKSRFLGRFLCLCSILLLSACSNAMQLAYERPPAAANYRGEIVVTLEDQRAAERGGDDPLKVGLARNAFGMPFDIKASPKREPSKVIKALVSECLMAAGYKVVDKPGPFPEVHGVLKVFWSDGYQHSRMGLLMPLRLQKSADAPPAWEYNLDINTGFTWKSAGFSQFNAGFNKMLETAKGMLLDQFKQPEFQRSYRSVAQ